MEKINYIGKDNEAKKAIDFIQQNALGNVVVALTTPTADTLKANSWTYYGGELFYKTSSGVSFKFSVTVI